MAHEKLETRSLRSVPTQIPEQSCQRRGPKARHCFTPELMHLLRRLRRRQASSTGGDPALAAVWSGFHSPRGVLRGGAGRAADAAFPLAWRLAPPAPGGPAPPGKAPQPPLGGGPGRPPHRHCLLLLTALPRTGREAGGQRPSFPPRPAARGPLPRPAIGR